MKNPKNEVLVEKSSDGEYWGTTQDFLGVVCTVGDSFEKMKKNLATAFADHLEIYKEEGDFAFIKKWEKAEFVYKMNFS